MIEKLRKKIDITNTIGNMGWFELAEQVSRSADEFHGLIASIPASADRIRTLRTMPLRDMVSHISDINFAVGSILDGLAQSKTVKFKVEKFYAGAGTKRWDNLLTDHLESIDWIEDQCERPISSLRKVPHHLYGPMCAREWLAFTINHYAYHQAQLVKILASNNLKSVGKTGFVDGPVNSIIGDKEQ